MALKILTVASEAFPLAKTGGLGDAVSGMARAVHSMGTDISVLLPAYRGVSKRLRHARFVGRLHGLPGGDARLIKGYCPDSGVGVLLLDNPALYDRDGLYLDADGVEYSDNATRFAALSHAAARVASGVHGQARADVLHAHDWHAALAPLVLRQMGIRDVRTVLTLHNVAFQGSFDSAYAEHTGLAPDLVTGSGLLSEDRINFLRAGIVNADKITVVSENYSREILTAQFGCGLDALLRERQSDLLAIPNGIDASLWNPATDPYLRACHFDADDMRNKAVCKRRLQSRFGLSESPNATMLVMGSRLTGQKMADVVANALPHALERHPDLQVCVVGCGEKQIEMQLQAVGERYAGRCAVHIGYSEDIAHLLHAGGDILLHGSRFEPFGLTPLYSMRYGTIPIGSSVGGMVDTIHDPGGTADDASMCSATGLLFHGDDEHSICEAITRALCLWSNRRVWRRIQRNAMQKDFSWERTAPAYIRCYQALCPDAVAATEHRLTGVAKPTPATPVLAQSSRVGVAA